VSYRLEDAGLKPGAESKAKRLMASSQLSPANLARVADACFNCLHNDVYYPYLCVGMSRSLLVYAFARAY
jgi:hypothetical protein